MSFQEYDYWGSHGGPLINSPRGQMVYILGASSLSRVIEKFDYNSKRTLKKTITAIPGFSFNQNNKNDLKVIPTLLSKRRLSKISKKEKCIYLARRFQQFPLQTRFKLQHPINAKAATANSHTLQALHISKCVLQTLRNS